MTKKQAVQLTSFTHATIRRLHGLVPRYRGKLRRYGFGAGNVSGSVMMVGILLANLDQPAPLRYCCYGLVLIGGIIGALISPAKLLFASARNWIAWAMFPPTVAGVWLMAATLIESWQLATHINTVPAHFITRFQPFWLSALAVSVGLAAVRWIFDGIYEGWPPEMKNPNGAAVSKSAKAVHMAFRSDVRLAGSKDKNEKIRFSAGKSADRDQTPPRTRRPHGKDNQ